MAKNNKNGPSDKIPQQTTAAKDATPASGNAGNDPGRRKTDLKKTPKPNSAPDNSKGQPNSTKTPKPDVDLAQGKPFSTQGSRETGYRDGTRAAEAAAHVKAYRDGLKDGWADTTEAAEREKARLDQTHQDRKQAREETPVTTDTSTDHHTDTSTDGPQPIKVDGIDATHLYLGDAAARPVISRGEVRTLKQYERRLADRLGGLQKTTEITKRLEAHAISQAQKALDLLEKARGVKGGDTFLGKLTRLHEDAQRQAAEAAEIHKRAVRAADACGALLANVATRYGDMYQAVVDSPETAPAELAYYQGA
ncbi:hypothetical protein ACIOEX_01485 [Streptomyces sp. NPDC087850]|uniref:hypothetical protein n=1 Tax=Streptomyces sp. NPDC087850 TaxID=3365809 RepID=UPI00382615E5